MPQYMVQTNTGAINVPANNQSVQYSLPTNQSNPATPTNGNGNSAAVDSDNSNGASSQTGYISSTQDNYTLPTTATVQPQQSFSADGTQTTGYSGNQPVNQSYSSSNGSNTTNYSQTPTTQPTNYNPPNGANTQNNQNYATNPTTTNTPQANFSPSSTPAPNQYPTSNMPNLSNAPFPPAQGSNPYPNATGQNLAAYANNQYQYNSRPWFRPRYGSPQNSPYGAGNVANAPPMPVPPPTGNYNYWQDS